jgi:hypothetical protein
MDKAWFDEGIIDIQGVTIVPNTSAKVQALCYYNNGVVQMKWVTIEGEEYKNWESDDDYLIALVGHKLGMGKRGVPVSNIPDVEPAKPITPYTFTAGLPAQPLAPVTSPAPAPAPVTYDDARSVHNDADLAKITTLEEQMVEQQRMVAQLKSILISKGMI